LHLVTPAGTVQVPEDVKTVMLLKPPAGVLLCQVVPLLVSTFPAVPGATTCTAEVPLPNRTLLAVSEDAPVPPLATGKVPVTLLAKLTNVVDVVPVPPFATGKVPETLAVKDTKVVELVPVPPLAIGKIPAGAEMLTF
jgi:hypothetical protein